MRWYGHGTRTTVAWVMAIMGSVGSAGYAEADADRASGGSRAARLEAGVAVIDLDPPRGYRMSGYFRERLNTGTHDPLRAKAIVFAQGESRAALVVCDIIGISPAVSRKARRVASERTGIPHAGIVIAATHSHTGPLYFGALRTYLHERAVAEHGRDPHEPVDYAAVLVGKLVEVIVRAHEAKRPVRLQAGVTREETLAFNRRFHLADGTVRFNPGQQNPNIVRVAGPIDPEVGLVLLSGAQGEGQPLAALTVFALHLDTTGGTEYSADYPYYLERGLRQALGPKFTSVFGIGTCGDINHIDVKVKTRPNAEQIGKRLAETVRDALRELPAPTPPALAVRSATVEAPLQHYSAERIARAKVDMAKVGTGDLPFLDQVEAYKILSLQWREGPTLPIEVQVIRLSREVAIVTLPGEVFVELGLAIKRASPFKTTLVIELANDAPGYIPTRKAFAEGSYETVNSRVQSGGGEAMVEVAVRLLEELAE